MQKCTVLKNRQLVIPFGNFIRKKSAFGFVKGIFIICIEMAPFSNSVNLFDFKSVICGFHFYQKIWDPQIDEELMCKLMEPSNKFDKNTVVKDDKQANNIGILTFVSMLNFMLS